MQEITENQVLEATEATENTPNSAPPTGEPVNLKGNPNEYIYPEGTKTEVDGQLISELRNLLTQLITSETVSGNYFQFKYFKEDGTHVKTPSKTLLESGTLRKELDWETTVYDMEQSHFLTQKGIGYARLLAHIERLHFINIQNGKAKHYSDISPVPEN